MRVGFIDGIAVGVTRDVHPSFNKFNCINVTKPS